ncbi:MAG TPA: DUF2249 domain-containing protein [Rhodospirillaceae bacterium]|nr:DUF2249 domain-containing protein [Rhodospirillaceae bacterium]
MTDKICFDLRPLLARGIDPLEEVLAWAETAGANLTLDAPFNPRPLRRVLAKKGFSSEAIKLDAGHWRVRLWQEDPVRLYDEAGDEDCQGLPPLEVPVTRSGGMLHLDLRGLPPPRPLLAIMRLCMALDEALTVLAIFDRDPLYLFPELAEIGWQADAISSEPGKVVLKIFKSGPG